MGVSYTGALECMSILATGVREYITHTNIHVHTHTHIQEKMCRGFHTWKSRLNQLQSRDVHHQLVHVVLAEVGRPKVSERSIKC